jgi:hypothetical protein
LEPPHVQFGETFTVEGDAFGAEEEGDVVVVEGVD